MSLSPHAFPKDDTQRGSDFIVAQPRLLRGTPCR